MQPPAGGTAERTDAGRLLVEHDRARRPARPHRPPRAAPGCRPGAGRREARRCSGSPSRHPVTGPRHAAESLTRPMTSGLGGRVRVRRCCDPSARRARARRASTRARTRTASPNSSPSSCTGCGLMRADVELPRLSRSARRCPSCGARAPCARRGTCAARCCPTPPAARRGSSRAAPSAGRSRCPSRRR